MLVTIKLLTQTAKKPQRMSPLAAGYDIFSDNIHNIVLRPMARAVIPTGFAISLPPGTHADIRSRSGLAMKHGVCVLNSPGTIDPDYRGEIGVILINLSDQDFVISPGVRIAQLLVSRHDDLDFSIENQLDDTHRGSGGFGSTG
jgi:dUTP pyrophosphatase